MTDLDLIRNALAPFKKVLPNIPFVDEGALFDQMFSHEKIKEVYDTVGGEAGVQALAAAIMRIGKNKVLGQP